jgi:hypothetical protein
VLPRYIPEASVSRPGIGYGHEGREETRWQARLELHGQVVHANDKRRVPSNPANSADRLPETAVTNGYHITVTP